MTREGVGKRSKSSCGLLKLFNLKIATTSKLSCTLLETLQCSYVATKPFHFGVEGTLHGKTKVSAINGCSLSASQVPVKNIILYIYIKLKIDKAWLCSQSGLLLQARIKGKHHCPPVATASSCQVNLIPALQ